MPLFEVVKVPGGHAVQDWTGAYVVAYRSRKLANDFAIGQTNFIFGCAEYENDRRDYIAAYLVRRAARVAVAPAQMELFG
jgi:hypothetical protein